MSRDALPTRTFLDGRASALTVLVASTLVSSSWAQETFDPKLFASRFVQGLDARLEVEDATPGATIYFLQSTTGSGPGVAQIGLCGPVDVALSDPITVVGTAPADAQGRAILLYPVPAGMSGVAVRFQAVDLETCIPTNPLVRHFERPVKVALVCEPPSSGSGKLHLVDLDSGQLRSTFQAAVADPLNAHVAPDGRTGYLTTGSHHVWGFDLRGELRLVPGANPIHLSTYGHDLAGTPDGRFLLTASDMFTQGGPPEPVVVVDTATHLEVDAVGISMYPGTLDVSADGAVVTSEGGPLVAAALRLWELDANGQLSSTGVQTEFDQVALGVHPDVDIAPDGRTVVGLEDCFDTVCDQEVVAYDTASLVELDNEVTDFLGPSGCFNAQGTRYFLRQDHSSGGRVYVFSYDPSIGDLTPLFHFAVPRCSTDVWGIEVMAYDDLADVLWLTSSSALFGYDAATGALVRTIPGVAGRGIALGPGVERNRARGESPQPAPGRTVDPGN